MRKQLPLKHAYAITANKSQGQTLAKVLFDARKPAFSGGQQYVVCSRVRRRGDFAAVVGNAQLLAGSSRAPRTLVVANVVYTELLDALTACALCCDAAPPSRSGKRAAPSLPTRAQRARHMDLCGVCDDEMDVG